MKFFNAYGELVCNTGLDPFVAGFRLIAKIIFDTFCNGDAPFDSLLEGEKICGIIIDYLQCAIIKIAYSQTETSFGTISVSKEVLK